MIRKNIALVVPTIRKDSMMQFFKRWDAIGLFDHVDLIIMEDNPLVTFTIETSVQYDHLCWKDIEVELGDDQWIIPRRSDTVRSYGYIYAYFMGYKYIVTLDDDCYPPIGGDDCIRYETAKQFIDLHLQYLNKKTKWFNTLNSVKPRGIPFENLGTNDNVIVNHGLWTNVLDYDAPTQLVLPGKETYSFDNRIVPTGMYFPMCGMNVMWKAEYTVLMYHLLMGKMFDGYIDPGLVLDDEYGKNGCNLKQLPFDRFGDIWCGIFMKKCADVLGKQVATGMPYIRHERASNPFTNLKKEANGLEVNERLWEYVDGLDIGSSDDQFATYDLLGVAISRYDEFKEYERYFKTLGKAMRKWVDLFMKDPKEEINSYGCNY